MSGHAGIERLTKTDANTVTARTVARVFQNVRIRGSEVAGLRLYRHSWVNSFPVFADLPFQRRRPFPRLVDKRSSFIESRLTSTFASAPSSAAFASAIAVVRSDFIFG